MPDIIIEQNQSINNYINILQLPYSSSIQNHMLNRVSKGKLLGIKTIGDTVRYLRQRYVVEIARFAYSFAAEMVNSTTYII